MNRGEETQPLRPRRELSQRLPSVYPNPKRMSLRTKSRRGNTRRPPRCPPHCFKRPPRPRLARRYAHSRRPASQPCRALLPIRRLRTTLSTPRTHDRLPPPKKRAAGVPNSAAFTCNRSWPRFPRRPHSLWRRGCEQFERADDSPHPPKVAGIERNPSRTQPRPSVRRCGAGRCLDSTGATVMWCRWDVDTVQVAVRTVQVPR